MSNRFNFEEIDFKEKEDKLLEELFEEVPSSKPVAASKVYKTEDFDEAVKLVEKELTLIKNGRSELLNYAVSDTSTPALHALGQLKAAPHPGQLELFCRLVKQDYGLRVARKFREIFEGVFHEETNK